MLYTIEYMTKWFRQRMGRFEIYDFDGENNEYKLDKKLGYTDVVKAGIRKILDLNQHQSVKQKPK